MKNSNIVMTVEIQNETGDVMASQVNTWNGLDNQQVLFMEKHLQAALTNINDEATELVNAAAMGESFTKVPGDFR